MSFSVDPGRQRVITLTATLNLVVGDHSGGDMLQEVVAQERGDIAFTVMWDDDKPTPFPIEISLHGANDYAMDGITAPTHGGHVWVYFGTSLVSSKSIGTGNPGLWGSKTITVTITAPVKLVCSYDDDGTGPDSPYFNELPWLSNDVHEETDSTYSDGLWHIDITGDLGAQSDTLAVTDGTRVGWLGFFDTGWTPGTIFLPDLTPRSTYGEAHLTGVAQGGVSFQYAPPALDIDEWSDGPNSRTHAVLTSDANSIDERWDWSGAAQDLHNGFGYGWGGYFEGPYIFNLVGNVERFDTPYLANTPIETRLWVGPYYADADITPYKRIYTDADGGINETLTLFNFSWMPKSGFFGWLGLPSPYYQPGARMHATELARLGERQADYGIVLWDKQVEAFTLAHKATLLVDNCNATTGWTAGVNTTLSSDGAAILGTIAGGTGNFYKTLAAGDLSLQGWRYLRINAKADANRTITMELTADMEVHPTDADYDWRGNRTLTWTLNLTNAYQDFDIDLCMPENGGPDYCDGLDGSVLEIKFSGLPDTSVIYIQDITARFDSPYLNSESDGQTDYDWSIADPPSRCWKALVNGKIALEGKLDLTSMADLLTFLQDENQAVTGGAGTDFGWTLTRNNPFTDGVDGWSNESYAGEAYSSREIGEFLHEALTTAALQVYRHIKLDALHIYPNCGDYLTPGAHGTPTVQFRKPLGARVHGLLQDSADESAAAAGIVEATIAGTSYGVSDPSSADGFYHCPGDGDKRRLLDPSGPTAYDLTWTNSTDSPKPTDNQSQYSRRYQQLHLRGAMGAGGGICNLVDRTGPFTFRAVCVNGSTYIDRSFQDGTNYVRFLVHNGDADSEPNLIVPTTQTRPLYCVIDTGSGVLQYTSHDLGETWT